MSQTINLPNYNVNNLIAQSRLQVPVAANDSIIVFQNTQGFNVNDLLVIGTPGDEGSELVTITAINSPNGVAISPSARFNHPAFDYLNSISGNTLNIYAAPNITGLQPDDSQYTIIGNVPIQPDSNSTSFTDPNGSNAFWYKFTYFNSVTNAETNLSDSKSARGGGTNDYCSISSIRLEAGFRNAAFITDQMIDLKRQAAQDEINGKLSGFYNTPFQKPINAFISDICTRLAAGLLLLEQYGQINTLNTADGNSKLTQARADLQMIVDKQTVLTDTNGISMALPGSVGGVTYWPGVSEDGYEDRQFRMRDIDGYLGRKW